MQHLKMNSKLFLFIILLGLTWSTSCKPREDVYDVVVYGGTSAGIICAVQLAIDGKNVAVVEPTSHIGGMTTEGLDGSDINNHPNFKNDAAVGGLTLEFYKTIAKHYGITDFEAKKDEFMTWRFEPHVADSIFLAWINKYKIPVFYGERLILGKEAINKQGSKINSFKTEKGSEYFAKIFVDATYEGDLLHYAGVSTTIGREANHQYNETKNGIRAENSYRNFEVDIDPYNIPGDSTSGVIHTVQQEYHQPELDGEGDQRIQAFCFRACLTKDSLNRVPFTKPLNYNREWYEIYLRYQAAGGKLYAPYYSIPNAKTDLGAWHDLSHNLYGMNHDYPAGDYNKRKEIYQYHLDFTQGLFWFLANDTAVHETTRDAWQQWGTTKDEFTDNNGWPRMIYIRDGRRMISDYVMTEHHTRKDTIIEVPQPVGVAYWPPDVHHVRRIIKDGSIYNEGFVFGGENWKPFSISYQSLIPKKEECTNVMTPTCPSSSHIAFGAIRLEWTFMVLGQSLGAAASLALEKEVAIQDIPYAALKELLLKEKQVLAL